MRPTPDSDAHDDRWSLRGRVALVAGGGRGLGLGCAHALAEAGAAVLVAARSGAEVEAAAAAITDAGGTAGATSRTSPTRPRLRAWCAPRSTSATCACCVNSAGTNRTGPARSYATADWDALFDVNVRATFLVCRAVATRCSSATCRGRS